MKNLNEYLRLAKTNSERAKIVVENAKWPGTDFDEMFKDARLVADLPIGLAGEAAYYCESFGRWLVGVINRRDVQCLHNLADALATMKRHKPKRDYALEVLFSMAAMFPPGWIKGRKIQRGKIVGGSPGEPVSIRDIRMNLARIDPEFDADKWASTKRRIQRYAKEFKIPLDKTPGRKLARLAT